MTIWTIVRRSLRFHWRTQLGVATGAAVGTAVLVGALLAGDSVRYTLRSLALTRLGSVDVAMATPDRYFRSDLPGVPVLRLQGAAVTPDGASRANSVQVLGVDRQFWSFALSHPREEVPPAGSVWLNSHLAAQLDAKPGDTVILRVAMPSLLPKDSPLFPKTEGAKAFRLTVSRIVADAEFGRFSLRANVIPPFNAFVSLAWLQEQANLPGRANVLLQGGGKRPLTAEEADQSLESVWQPADAGVEVRELPAEGVVEIRSPRIFLEPAVVDAARKAAPEGQEILAYLVNEIRLGDSATPYSIVAAIGPLSGGTNGAALPAGKKPGLEVDPGKIAVADWLAEDLGAKPGDSLEMTYFVLRPDLELAEQTNRFAVSRIVPLKDSGADPEMMPDFPGVQGVESCREWKSGLPLDFSRIRPKDEDYWNRYRGTPKAFVSMEDGRAMWANRFGSLTAIRVPLNGWTSGKLSQALKRELDPASVGLSFQPVREQALKAGAQSEDFGQLFLGLSFFLIVAALLLTGLLFVLGVEQRREEMGTLRAVGWSPSRIRRIWLAEAGALAVLGAVVGGIAGVAYGRAVIGGLATVWRGAVAGAPLRFHAAAGSWLIGTLSGLAVSFAALAFAVRRQSRAVIRELLTEGAGLWLPMPRRRRTGWVMAWSATAVLAIALAAWGAISGGSGGSAPALFFTSGALLLAAGVGLAHSLLMRLGLAPASGGMTLPGLSARNASRRSGRSLAVVLLLACGSFLVVAVGANRQSPGGGLDRPSAGTGGYRFIGQLALPFFGDLNRASTQGQYGLDPAALRGVEFTAVRVREGDDASCLNLNRAQNPRLLGVAPEALATRGRFTFTVTERDAPPGRPWLLLDGRGKDGAIPAVGDEATIVWGLHKSLGDTIRYPREGGGLATIRIAGVIANSMLQGNLVISERNFTELFPSEGGYRMLWVDAPPARAAELRAALSRSLEDYGLELTPAAEKLSAYLVVENTYLSIFQALGGLGLLLGSVGLGLVVARNILERRAELALLRAVGFVPGRLRRLILAEHVLLLVLGLGIGVVSALVAVTPALASSAAGAPYASLGATLAAVFLSGLLWTWLAVSLALRGHLLDALRSE